MNMNFENNPLLTDAESIANCPSPVPSDSEFGIDTVTLSFTFSSSLLDLDSPLWRRSSSGIFLDSGKEFANNVGFHETEHGTVRVSLNLLKQTCSLHFNAARILTGKSRQLLHPNALKPLVGALFDEIAYAVGGEFDINESTGVLERSADWTKRVSISRLDLARNLKVTQIPQLKKALQLAVPKNGKIQHVYEEYNGAGWTLVNGTKTAGKDRIYDKDAELNGLNPEDQLVHNQSWFRFETQLENDRLNKYGLTTLESVNDESCWDALEDRWKACNWSVAIVEPGTLSKALSNLSPKEQQGLAGYLWQCEQGTEGTHTKARNAEYRKKALALGLTPGMPMQELGAGILKLDLHAGGLIPDPTQG